MKNRPETFEYTYSAKRQEEIRSIRRKYMMVDESEDKMELLRKLDKSATRKGMIVSITLEMCIRDRFSTRVSTFLE